jgi:hypothetical protein
MLTIQIGMVICFLPTEEQVIIDLIFEMDTHGDRCARHRNWAYSMKLHSSMAVDILLDARAEEALRKTSGIG